MNWAWQPLLPSTALLSIDPCPSGPRAPSLMANIAVGDVAWSNTENAKVSDDVYATAVTVAQTTQQLQATTFHFHIDPAKTIVGIVVECEAKSTLIGNTVLCRIIKGGSVSATSRSNTWETTEAQVSYGGSTDLWGETWTPSDINANNFGVSIRQESGLTATLSIDAVRITIHCSSGGTVYTRTLSDGVTAGDSAVRGARAFRQMPADPVALSEVIARSQQHGRVISGDSVALLDTLLRGQQHGRVLGEAVNVSDAAQRVALLFHGLADSVTVSESLLRTALLFRKASDDITISEETRRTVRIFRQTTDVLDVRDDTLRFAQLFRRLLDDARVTDTLTVTLTLAGVIIVTRILQDNLNVADAVQRAVRMYRLESQAVDVQDGTWYSRNIVRAVTETLTVADSVARMLLLTRTVSDRVDAADAALRFVLLNRIAREDVDAVDSLASQVTYFQQIIGFVLMSLRSDPIVLGVEASAARMSFAREDFAVAALEASVAELSFAEAEPILMELRNL